MKTKIQILTTLLEKLISRIAAIARPVLTIIGVAAIYLLSSLVQAVADTPASHVDNAKIEKLLNAFFISDRKGSYAHPVVVKWKRPQIILWFMDFSAADEKIDVLAFADIARNLRVTGRSSVSCALGADWQREHVNCNALRANIVFVNAKTSADVILAKEYLSLHRAEIEVSAPAIDLLLNNVLSTYQTGEQCQVAVEYGNGPDNNTIESAIIVDSFHDETKAARCALATSFQALGVNAFDLEEPNKIDPRYATQALQLLYSDLIAVGAKPDDVERQLKSYQDLPAMQ